MKLVLSASLATLVCLAAFAGSAEAAPRHHGMASARAHHMMMHKRMHRVMHHRMMRRMHHKGM